MLITAFFCAYAQKKVNPIIEVPDIDIELEKEKLIKGKKVKQKIKFTKKFNGLKKQVPDTLEYYVNLDMPTSFSNKKKNRNYVKVKIILEEIEIEKKPIKKDTIKKKIPFQLLK